MFSTTNDDFGGYPSGDSRPTFYPNAPPPPGFRSEFTQGAPAAGASCGARPSNEGSTGAGGFWTGAATGGLLGYMFGNRNKYNLYYITLLIFLQI